MKTKTVCKGCGEPFGASHSINGYCMECVDAAVVGKLSAAESERDAYRDSAATEARRCDELLAERNRARNETLAALEKLERTESELSAAHRKNTDLSFHLGKAQGEAEGHALVRRGLESELATERSIVEEYIKLTKGLKAELAAERARVAHLETAARLLRESLDPQWDDNSPVIRRMAQEQRDWLAADALRSSQQPAPPPAEPPQPPAPDSPGEGEEPAEYDPLELAHRRCLAFAPNEPGSDDALREICGLLTDAIRERCDPPSSVGFVTLADVDRRIAQHARAASEACGKVSGHGWPLAKLAEVAEKAECTV